MDSRALCQLYLMGEATDEQVAELSAWIAESPKNAEVFALLAAQDAHFSTAVSKVCQPAQTEAPDFLSQLDHPTLEPKASTGQQYRSALSYVLRHTFTPKRLTIVATAAALLLGVVLMIVMLTSPEDSETIGPIAGQPDNTNDPTREPGHVGPAPTSIVATLTAHRNAVWAPQPGGDVRPGALRPGTPLSAGQRLILTQGFAEITTNDGAIAILEAPATIQLLDNTNALQLFSGKLVGICETDSSKGFLVRTPHMDVTDLGTRFGVDARESSSHTYVLAGEIEVSASQAEEGVSVKQLGVGESARVDAGVPVVSEDDAAGLRFVHQFPHPRNTPRVEGTAKFELALPTRLGPNQTESDDLLIFLERSGIELQEELVVSFGQTGEYRASPDQQSTVAAGTRVSSYLLHLDWPGSKTEPKRPSCQATITFDQPVIGVIASDTGLDQTDRLLGVQGLDYVEPAKSAKNVGPGRGLEGVEDQTGDYLSLSPDRRTLTIRWASYRASDQVRVLVEANE